MFKTCMKPPLTYVQTSGSFNSQYANLPLKSCVVNLPISQQGSGTPSPTNIRDFVGVSQAVIGQTSGYGEYFRGLLNGTYRFVRLSSLTWNVQDGPFYSLGIRSNVKRPSSNDDIASIACEKYTATSRNDLFDNEPDYSMAVNSAGTLQIRDSDYSTLEDFVASLSNVYLIYETAEPTTPVTPEQFATLCQAFGITGNTYQITFGQTVYSAILDVLNGKLYLIDEIKTIDENSGVTRATTNVFYLPDFFDAENDTESINCNVYERGENKSTGGGVVSNPDYSFCCRTTSNQLYIKDVRYNTITDYNDYLANNPVKIAVKLAEPIVIPLGGIDIKTLLGVNNLISSVGNISAEFIKFGR